jgi:hypothetical protein
MIKINSFNKIVAEFLEVMKEEHERYIASDIIKDMLYGEYENEVWEYVGKREMSDDSDGFGFAIWEIIELVEEEGMEKYFQWLDTLEIKEDEE